MEKDIEDEKQEGRKERAPAGLVPGSLIQMQKYNDVKNDQHTRSDPYQSRSIPGKALKTAHLSDIQGQQNHRPRFSMLISMSSSTYYNPCIVLVFPKFHFTLKVPTLRMIPPLIFGISNIEFI